MSSKNAKSNAHISNKNRNDAEDLSHQQVTLSSMNQKDGQSDSQQKDQSVPAHTTNPPTGGSEQTKPAGQSAASLADDTVNSEETHHSQESNDHEGKSATISADSNDNKTKDEPKPTQTPTKHGPSMATQAGELAGAAVRNVKNNSRHNPLYLGMVVAFALASLGMAFSTFPIFLSLPIAGILLGISVWLLGHVGIINFSSGSDADESEKNHRKKLVRLSTLGTLVALQIAITDVFVFTRLGSVSSQQNSIVVAWLIITVVEAVVAAVIIVSDLYKD